MEDRKLKQEALDAIKTDPTLYGKVAAELNVAPASLPRLIYNNNKKLTQAGVLKVISEYLNIENSEDLMGPEIIREDKLTTVL